MYYKQRQPGAVKTITADWKTIPWEQANEIYNEAADLAEGTALVEYRQQVAEKYADAKLDELQLPNKTTVRRKAGNKALVEVFIPRYKLSQFGIAVISQIVAHIATLRVFSSEGEHLQESPEAMQEVTTPGGLGYVGQDEYEWQRQYAVSGLEFVKAHFKTPYMMGLYRFLMLDSRSSYLTKQYSGDARSYCALVPLILSAFKRYHNIPYSAWKKDELKYVVNPELCKAMMYELPPGGYDEEGKFTPKGFSKETLLELRDQGLLWKSGANIGKLRNPLFTHTLYGLTGTVFEDVPDLAQVMLTQIWCAHPDNRTKYMVLTPDDWDNIPPSLIAPALFVPPVYTNTAIDMPWDA